MHLAIFITICESFLGIDPHFGLWKKIFFAKRHCNPNGPFVTGGVGFSVRKDVRYFAFPMRESVQGWRHKWFYMRDERAPTLCSGRPKFVDVLEAKPKKSWKNIVRAEESATVEELYGRIQELRTSGGQVMLGTEFVALFLKRRI